jgi:hypothetical protein
VGIQRQGKGLSSSEQVTSKKYGNFCVFFASEAFDAEESFLETNLLFYINGFFGRITRHVMFFSDSCNSWCLWMLCSAGDCRVFLEEKITPRFLFSLHEQSDNGKKKWLVVISEIVIRTTWVMMTLFLWQLFMNRFIRDKSYQEEVQPKRSEGDVSVVLVSLMPKRIQFSFLNELPVSLSLGFIRLSYAPPKLEELVMSLHLW